MGATTGPFDTCDDDRPRGSRSHWLCVAYAFPPINRSGTHRTLGFVRHLDALGWDATVLTVEPGGEPVDPVLSDLVLASTRVVRTEWTHLVEAANARLSKWSPHRRRTKGTQIDSAVAAEAVQPPGSRSVLDWVSRLLMLPDSRLGWIPAAVSSGAREIRRRRPRVIYTTSPYMSAHLVGLILSRWTRVPWVADFRDPWRGNPFRELRYPSLDIWDGLLESMVLRRASHIVCNTPTMRDDLVQRMPSVEGKSSTILNGFDEALLAQIEPRREAPGDRVVLAHSGEFYGPRSPLPWFRALRQAIKRVPELRPRVEFLMLGREDYDGEPLRALAHREGVGECVTVGGHRPHRDALALMKGCDGLILAGPAGPGSHLQVPNKLFEYLAMQRPILATAPEANPIREILQQANAEAIICSPEDTAALADGIIHLAKGEPIDTCGEPWSGVELFSRRQRVVELASVFVGVGTGAAVAAKAPPLQNTLVDRPAAGSAHDLSDQPAVSVVTTVGDDVDQLQVTLESLRRQSCLPSEVVVAPRSTRPETTVRLDRLLARHTEARKVTGKTCNRAVGRNRAIRAASGELVACIDAGCQAEPQWLEKLVAPFADPNVSVVGGACAVAGWNIFERAVGHVLLPTGLSPRNAREDIPPSESIAFRRQAWEAAFGYPNWLGCGARRLFALKLRTLEPPVGYALAPDARVGWRPPRTPWGAWQTAFATGRGEARIGHGVAAHGYENRRYIALALSLLAIAWGGWSLGPALSALGWTVLLILFVTDNLACGKRVARQTGSRLRGAVAMPLHEVVMLARWCGRFAGILDRRGDPDVYVTRLGDYFGSDSADVSVPPWCVKQAAAPQTIVMSTHWPVHGSWEALVATKPSWLNVIRTRSTGDAPMMRGVNTSDVFRPWSRQRVGWFWTRLADLCVLQGLVRSALRRHAAGGVERVVAPHKDRLSLVAAWLAARWIDVPMAVSLETQSTFTTRGPWAFWERALLRNAWLVIAPDERTARSCRESGVPRVRVWQDGGDAEQRLRALQSLLVEGWQPGPSRAWDTSREEPTSPPVSAPPPAPRTQPLGVG